MPAGNTATSWGWVSKTFHWLVFFLVVGLLVVAWIMTDMPDGPDKGQLYGLHKAFGVVLLVLMVARLLWRMGTGRPALPAHLNAFEASAAHLNHAMLYVVLIAMPVAGIVMSLAAGYPIDVFGLFTLPAFETRNIPMAMFAHTAHEILAWAVVALAGLHILAALRHHFVLRDTVLRRMLPGMTADQ